MKGLNKTLVLITFFLSVLLFSCKKVEKANPNFIGIWYCDERLPDYRVYLEIKHDGNAIYSEMNYGGTVKNVKGRVRITSNKLYLGNFHHMSIFETPHLIDTSGYTIIMNGYDLYKHMLKEKANWRMKLSKMEPIDPSHYGGNTMVFYKADY